MTNTEWRKALNKSVENYQSTSALHEENSESLSLEQHMDAAAGDIEQLLKQYGALIVLSLMDEIDELQERSKPLQDKDMQRVIGVLEHPAGINAAGKQMVRYALVELQKLRRSYLAIRGEIESLQAQLYEAENPADASAGELQKRRKTSELPLKKVDRCDVCTEGARGGCGTCIFNGNFE
ncbi:hypothetical protein QMO17_24620 [Klebsiella pneumoniae]|uniref:hypothetical protein n=1 Tax=Klebsiella pneumoniae TaxID=573 RepID=UPI000A26D92D|nr:hypothetical protein [Klebsiella pneumoniae]MDI7013983.1 hypothetical protein [Klebsiella pneumoniae]MDI7064516.1 hypothetical protein [Klebsiella pneumoniae]MDI7101348.1 hypothetical protein [Klebsiella pneumoniae]